MEFGALHEVVKKTHDDADDDSTRSISVFSFRDGYGIASGILLGLQKSETLNEKSSSMIF